MIVKLGSLISEYSVRNKSNEDIPVYSVTNEQGFCTGYFNKEVASQDRTTYKIVPRGCFAYNPSRINVGSVDVQEREDRVIVSPLYVVFTVDQRLNRKYLLHYLKSDIAMTLIKAYASGSVRDNLKFSILKDFPINLPSVETQEGIVENLDRIEHLIELRKKELSSLDELVKSRFIELFGDLTSNTYGWETYTFDECFDITSSKRILKSEWKEKGIPFLRVRDMVQLATTGTMDNEFFVSEEFYASLSDSDGVPVQGDILVSATSTLGKCHVVGDGERFYFKDADVLRFRPQRAINPIFFMEQMKTTYIEEQIARTLGVTTVAHFTIKAAKTISMRCPDIELQEMFASFVEQTDKSKFLVSKVLNTLYKWGEVLERI